MYIVRACDRSLTPANLHKHLSAMFTIPSLLRGYVYFTDPLFWFACTGWLAYVNNSTFEPYGFFTYRLMHVSNLDVNTLLNVLFLFEFSTRLVLGNVPIFIWFFTKQWPQIFSCMLNELRQDSTQKPHTCRTLAFSCSHAHMEWGFYKIKIKCFTGFTITLRVLNVQLNDVKKIVAKCSP